MKYAHYKRKIVNIIFLTAMYLLSNNFSLRFHILFILLYIYYFIQLKLIKTNVEE